MIVGFPSKESVISKFNSSNDTQLLSDLLPKYPQPPQSSRQIRLEPLTQDFRMKIKKGFTSPIKQQSGREHYQKLSNTQQIRSPQHEERSNYFSSRDHSNSYDQLYDEMVEKKLQVSSQNVSPEYTRPLLEELQCHDENYLKSYRIKIDLIVKSTLMNLRKNHIGQRLEDLVQFRPQQQQEEKCRKACKQGIQYNRMRELHCADKAYLVFEKYKDQLIREHRSSLRHYGAQEQNIQNALKQLHAKPSSAIKQAKRKLKSSRKDKWGVEKKN